MASGYYRGQYRSIVNTVGKTQANTCSVAESRCFQGNDYSDLVPRPREHPYPSHLIPGH